MQTTGRQIGSALGFAILVAVLGTPRTAGDFKAAWEFMIAASLLAGATLVAIGGRASVPAQFATAQQSPNGVTQPMEVLI